MKLSSLDLLDHKLVILVLEDLNALSVLVHEVELLKDDLLEGVLLFLEHCGMHCEVLHVVRHLDGGFLLLL